MNTTQFNLIINVLHSTCRDYSVDFGARERDTVCVQYFDPVDKAEKRVHFNKYSGGYVACELYKDNAWIKWNASDD